MTRFRLHLEYDGRHFMGWQRQRHGPSVQEALETAVHEITGEDATVQGAGRTDSGVHASCMVAHVDIEKKISPFRLMEGINARLRAAKAATAVLDCFKTSPDFHARFSCVQRHYRYDIVCRRAPLTYQAGFAWRRPQMLDVPAMREAAAMLVGRHDFTTFRHAHCQANSPLRTLEALEVEAKDNQVSVTARARSFLHHQVRSMVGALVTVGEGKWTAADVKTALEARDRSLLPINAPADGLWFTGAEYPETSN